MTKDQFSQLVSQYERLVYTVCFQLVRDAAAAEDLTQETFLSAWLHRDGIPQGYERQWLGRIAANKAKDHLQSAWTRHSVLPGDEAMPPGLAPPAEEAVLHRGGDRGLKRALPPRVPPVPAGGEVPGGGGPGPGQAGENGTYAALPGQTAAAGAIGKERRIWSGSALTDI